MITMDRRDSAVRSVRALRELDERPDIIVVDNGSTDGTTDALGVPGVRLIELGRNLGASGRTVGVQAARTDYVAFSDDDSWWAPGALRRAVEVLDADPDLALVAGRTLVLPDAVDDPINAELASAPLGTDPDLPGPKILGFLACASVVRRRAYLQVGGFHRKFGVGGEEQLLALDLLSAGWRMCYLPDAVAYHHPGGRASRPGRAERQLRNELWTAWLRRPLPHVVRCTAPVVANAFRDPTARRALGQALAGLPWVLTERRAVTQRVEGMLRRVEDNHRRFDAGSRFPTVTAAERTAGPPPDLS